MAHFRFASLTHGDSIGYMFDNSSFRSTDDSLASWAFAYETYGHGMVQHSPERHVFKEHMIDFLRSLATHVAKPENADDLAALASEWNNFDFADEVEFLMNIKHVPYDQDDKKTWKKQYFNINERKVSSAESKQHDKRWTKVEEGMDGSIGFCMTQIMQIHYVRGLISRYDLMTNVANTFEQCHQWYPRADLPLLSFGITTDKDRYRLETAFKAVNELVKAYKGHKYANRLIDGWEDDSLKLTASQSEAS